MFSLEAVILWLSNGRGTEPKGDDAAAAVVEPAEKLSFCHL